MCNNEFKFAAFLHCTQITGFMQNLRSFVEEILGCDLAFSIGITDKIEAKKWIEQYKDVTNFEYFGNTRYQYPFIADQFPDKVNWDIKQIRIPPIT